MKDKRWKQQPYQQIIRKMYMQTLLVAGGAIIVVLLLRSAGNGFIGNWITTILCRLYNVDWEEGVWLYRIHVRQYYPYLIVFSIIVTFFAFFRILAPTGGEILAALAMCKTPYGKWVRYLLPLFAMWWVVAFIFLIYATQIGYGPF